MKAQLLQDDNCQNYSKIYLIGCQRILQMEFQNIEPYTQWGLPPGAKGRFGKGLFYDLQFSPDGRLIAVGSSIGVWLFDSQTIKEVNYLAGHKDFVTNVYFNPKGKTLVSQSGDGQYAPIETKLWNVPSGKLITTQSKQVFSVNYIVFSPDGKTLAIAYDVYDDNKLQLYDGFSGELKSTIRGHTYQVLAFSPDGKTIACGKSELIRLLNVSTGEVMSTFAAHANNIKTIKYFPNGKLLVSHGEDNNVCLWNADTGEFVRNFRDDTSNVTSIDISRDSKKLAIINSKGTLTLWNSQTGEKIKTISKVTKLNSVQYSPDGKTFACDVGENGTMLLFDAEAGELLHNLKMPGIRTCENDFGYSPDGCTLAVSNGFEIFLYDVNSGELQSTNKGFAEVLYDGITFNPNENQLTSYSYIVGIWDLNHYKLQKTIETNGMVSVVTYSPDGKTMAIGNYDDTISLWDLTKWEIIYTLEGHTDCITSVEFSPDSKVIASACCDNTIKMWDANTGEQIQTLSGYSTCIDAMRFSTNEQKIVVIGDDRIVKTWNVKSGEIVNTIEMNFEGVSFSSICFSPDGKTLATASESCNISLWDVSTGEHKNSANFEDKGDYIVYPTIDIVYSPNSKIIACAVSCLIFLWDVETGELLNTLKGHLDKINSITFSSDGKTLASSSRDNTVILWDFTK